MAVELDELSKLLRIRGDAAVAVIEDLRTQTKKQLDTLDQILMYLKSMEENLGVAGSHKQNLLGLLRQMNPALKDLPDEELLKKLGQPK